MHRAAEYWLMFGSWFLEYTHYRFEIIVIVEAVTTTVGIAAFAVDAVVKVVLIVILCVKYSVDAFIVVRSYWNQNR